jgi:hypothetical protein
MCFELFLRCERVRSLGNNIVKVKVNAAWMWVPHGAGYGMPLDRL